MTAAAPGAGVDRLLVTLEELRASEEELRESAEELAAAREVVEAERRRYHELFEFAPDGYLVTSEKGTIREANRAAGELFGVSPDFLIGKPLVLFVAREQRAKFLSGLRTAGRSEAVRLLEITLLSRKRRPLVAEAHVAAVRTGYQRVIGFRWLVRDVTERHEDERSVRASHEQLRALWARLESVREEERTRIARELHDEFGQAITALKFDLKALAGSASRIAGPVGCLERMSEQLDQMLTAVRRISRELRPSLLDDLGLEAAAEWLTREFAARTGIECRLLSAADSMPADRAVATAAFRILQEALTNVARHACARTVEVRLVADDSRLALTVIDDGKGIPGERLQDDACLGLIGMRERARMVGGTVAVEPLPAGGTRVSLSIPPEAPR